MSTNPIESAFREGWGRGHGAHPKLEHAWATSTTRAHPYGPRVDGPPTEEGVWWCEVRRLDSLHYEPIVVERGEILALGKLSPMPHDYILAHYAAPVPRPEATAPEGEA